MPDESKDQAEKKIIVDEDWKAQVEAEKERLARQAQGGPKQAAAAEEPPLPPASLSGLITSLGMQATMALGLVATAEGETPKPRLNVARHLIDTLAMLEEKTAGNRTPEESALLDNLLHELRMGYLAVQQHAGAPQEGG